ncbi:MAG: hypothetical protein IT318_17710 [Anaerolineales bacterium]|nr:hypothetical protein [Anaerolineales bacterium]
MNPYVLLIVGSLGLLGCLILLVFGVQMMREERAARQAREAASGATPGALPSDPPAEAPAAPAPARASLLSGLGNRLGSGRPRGAAHEVLRVLRDNLTGRLLIEIGGQRYANLDDLPDPILRQGLMAALRDLSDFAGAGAAAHLPPAGAHGALPAVSAGMPQAAPRPQPGRAARPTGPAAEPRPLPPPSMNPFKQMQVLRELAKNLPPPPKSIAEQINDALQARIADTALVQRGLHMRPGPRGEANFHLDGQSYPSVEDVPDEEARAVIRAAIADWEQGGG